MAKSLRSKSKRSFRSKKRESGKYAVADAARLNRLNARLAAVKGLDRTAEEMVAEDPPQEPGMAWVQWSGVADDDERFLPREIAIDEYFSGAVPDAVQEGENMSVDEPNGSNEKPAVVSTHGSRGSRREEWRKSKGMDPIPKRRGMNRQGGLAARRKAGRPSRRR